MTWNGHQKLNRQPTWNDHDRPYKQISKYIAEILRFYFYSLNLILIESEKKE
jgi:hypothetical protein